MKIGVLLSGCGVYDGSEIHESVLTLLNISKLGAEAVCLAPDIAQKHVVNHLTGKEMPESRNVLVEAARIARGKIRNLKSVQASEVDALILPGGFGAAKNLSTFAFDGAKATVDAEVSRLVKEVHAAGKPIGAICIAPAVISKIFEGSGIKVTVGVEEETVAEIQKLGQIHENCSVGEIAVDRKNKIVSTPAYMYEAKISEVAAGIEKLVKEVAGLVNK